MTYEERFQIQLGATLDLQTNILTEIKEVVSEVLMEGILALIVRNPDLYSLKDGLILMKGFTWGHDYVARFGSLYDLKT